jgi:hypothetical protein
LSEFVLLCDDTTIYCDSVEYYCDGSVVKRDFSYETTSFTDVSYQSLSTLYPVVEQFANLYDSEGVLLYDSNGIILTIISTTQYNDVRY